MSSYYVKKLESGNWRILEEVWKNGKRRQLTVPQQAYEGLGINRTASIDEIRLRIKQINKSSNLDRMTMAARRVHNIEFVDSVFFLRTETEEFLNSFDLIFFGNQLYIRKMNSNFRFFQKMINELQIEPMDYFDLKERIYKYFIQKKISMAYVTRLLRIANLYGKFVCRKRKQLFEPIPTPKGRIRQAISESYHGSPNFQGESDPLTPLLLQQLRENLVVPGNYEWLFISIWLGLRPIEVNSLHKPVNYRLEHDSSGTPIIWVYQSKLTSIEPEKRWKGIPVLYPEQTQALEIITKGFFKMPLNKTMRKIFPGRITRYGGRKNFMDMMLAKGHSLEHISGWLGHQDIQTTWSKYRNKKSVGY